jgi:hypothetical protein
VIKLGESYYEDADERRWNEYQARDARRDVLARRGYKPASSDADALLHHVPCGLTVVDADVHDKLCLGAST